MEALTPTGKLSDRLSGKIALVTGIGSGIGRGCALMMARHGAVVAGVDINLDAAEATAKSAADEGLQISPYRADLTRPDDVTDLVACIAADQGLINVLVNAAAIAEFVWLQDMDYEKHWRRTLTGELDTVFLVTKAVWPQMIAAGGGAIINLASANAYVALKGSAALAHTAGKGGVLAMTRQLAMEGAPHGIRANSISPGMIVTGATRPVLDNADFVAAVKEKLMLDRLGQPEDIAWGAVYLASDEASFVTGTDLSIDGGALAW